MSGKRDDLVKCVRECANSGNHHTLDPSIDNGKWLASKILKESSDVQGKCSVSAVPFTPSSGWHAFPSHNIPSLFNYGHVHFYALESIQNNDDTQDIEDIEDGLRHMTDKPLKNGRKYVNSCFVHDLMDMIDGDRYFVRAHVWPSMRTELPHNLVVDISLNSGAVLHASCEPCHASSLGCCSHVVAVLFSALDYVQNHEPVLTQPCTSQECSWNKGKKRNKNPKRVSDAKYPSKRAKLLSVTEFDPRPAKYREVQTKHINNFLSNIQLLSQAEVVCGRRHFTYNDYSLDCERSRVLFEKVTALHNNLKPEALLEMQGTQEQSKSEKWFSERWCRLKVSFCISN